jgi:GUN4-like
MAGRYHDNLIQALNTWQNKHAELEKQLAVTSNPNLIFELREQIKECLKEIERLKANIASTSDFSSYERPSGTQRAYTKLKELLESHHWKEADQETTNIMRTVVFGSITANTPYQLSLEQINRLPYECIRTINQYWEQYSDGFFGFKKQYKIWHKVNNPERTDREIGKVSPNNYSYAVVQHFDPNSSIKWAFLKQVGWSQTETKTRTEGSWLFKEEKTYQTLRWRNFDELTYKAPNDLNSSTNYQQVRPFGNQWSNVSLNIPLNIPPEGHLPFSRLCPKSSFPIASFDSEYLWLNSYFLRIKECGLD